MEIVGVSRRLLDNDGPDAVTMRRVADELGIQAPSLYKHFPNKAALELALIEEALVEIGEVSHSTIQLAAPDRCLGALLDAYRSYSLSHPHLYRLATSGHLAREGLSPGLEEWAGNPWYVVTGDAYLAQALWSFAHGMVVLELDDRYLPGSDLSRTWSAGACAFQHRAALGRPASGILLRTRSRAKTTLRPKRGPTGHRSALRSPAERSLAELGRYDGACCPLELVLEKSVAGTGQLTTYLGSAPGVGKTYTMLTEGRRRAGAGERVVVGWVERHGRPGTLAQLDHLEVIEPSTVTYRGHGFEEMDVPQLLAADADLIIVDELAHSFPDGSRERWMDVAELLAGGADVFTTVNVANLISARDYAARLTGAGTVEAVPDDFVRAGEVVLVDMPPDALEAEDRIGPGVLDRPGWRRSV